MLNNERGNRMWLFMLLAWVKMRRLSALHVSFLFRVEKNILENWIVCFSRKSVAEIFSRKSQFYDPWRKYFRESPNVTNVWRNYFRENPNFMDLRRKYFRENPNLTNLCRMYFHRNSNCLAAPVAVLAPQCSF